MITSTFQLYFQLYFVANVIYELFFIGLIIKISEKLQEIQQSDK